MKTQKSEDASLRHPLLEDGAKHSMNFALRPETFFGKSFLSIAVEFTYLVCTPTKNRLGARNILYIICLLSEVENGKETCMFGRFYE
jgi:hypothetical protein